MKKTPFWLLLCVLLFLQGCERVDKYASPTAEPTQKEIQLESEKAKPAVAPAQSGASLQQQLSLSVKLCATNVSQAKAQADSIGDLARSRIILERAITNISFIESNLPSFRALQAAQTAELLLGEGQKEDVKKLGEEIPNLYIEVLPSIPRQIYDDLSTAVLTAADKGDLETLRQAIENFEGLAKQGKLERKVALLKDHILAAQASLSPATKGAAITELGQALGALEELKGLAEPSASQQEAAGQGT